MLQALGRVISNPYIQRIIGTDREKKSIPSKAKLPEVSVHKNQFKSLFPPRLYTPSKKVTDGIPFTQDFVDSLPQGEVRNAVDSSVFLISPSGKCQFGSGFYLSPKYVLSAQHVVDGVDSILPIVPVTEFARVIGQNVMPDDTKCSAVKVLYSSKKSDLALLEVLDPKPDQPHVKFADQGAKRGDIIYSFGINGLKTGQVITDSSSGKRNRTTVVTMPLRPGDSGGLVTNSLGEAVGVVNYGGMPGIVEGFNRAMVNIGIRSYNNDPRRNGDVRLSLIHSGTGRISGLEKISQFFTEIGQDIKSFQETK